MSAYSPSETETIELCLRDNLGVVRITMLKMNLPNNVRDLSFPEVMALLASFKADYADGVIGASWLYPFQHIGNERKPVPQVFDFES